jgi:hypothetical protein
MVTKDGAQEEPGFAM